MMKKQQKTIQKQNHDIIYGVHPVLEMLQAKRRKVLAVYTTQVPIKAWPSIKKLLPSYVQVSQVNRDILTKMADTADHQGIVVAVSPFVYNKEMFSAKTHPFLLVLDGIQDVRNVGAILRSAYCAGVDGVVLTKKGSASLHGAVIKSSAGLAEHVQIYLASTIGDAVTLLKQQGYHLYLATLGGGVNAAEIAYTLPAALVIGNEESGISQAVFKQGTRILLPQRRPDISYNASVAAGILLFLMGTHLKKI